MYHYMDSSLALVPQYLILALVPHHHFHSNFCDQDCDSDDNNVYFQSSTGLRFYILRRLLHKLRLRPLRRILSQNNVDYDSNGSFSYLRWELKKKN
jgi:hypothetical protein